MKILSVKFLNLNSLKGEHEIRFDKSPISDSGLFAITGPTGAGKTTILDAISVALYGKVHRHGRNTDEIMTRHTGECYSEVEFDVNGAQYRAKWSLARSFKKAGGNMQSPKMELAEINGKIISDQRLWEVQTNIVEICNLDYDQFMRSVMLSQGDFARFLKSNENERSELLEKITDTHIYSDISEFVFSETKTKEGELEGLTFRRQTLEPFIVSKEDYATYLQTLESLTQKVTEETTTIKALDEQVKWLQNLERLNTSITAYSEKIKRFEEQLESCRQDFEKLGRHKKALPFRNSLNQIEQSGERVKALSGKMEKVQALIPTLEIQIQQAKTLKSEAATKANLADNVLKNISPVIFEVTERDGVIRSEENQSLKLKSDLNILEQRFSELSQQVIQKETKVNQLKTDIAQLSKWVTEHEHDEQLGKEIVKLQSILSNIEEGVSRGRSIKDEVKERESEKEKAQNETTAIRNRLETIKAELALLLENQNRLAKERDGVLSANSIEEVEEQLNRLPGLISAAGEMKNLAANYAHEKEQVSANDTALVLNIAEQEKQTSFARDLEACHEQEVATLQDIKRIVELEKMIQKYEQARGHINEGDPCPLCGSTHHPYIESDHRHKLTDEERRYNKQEQTIRDIDAEKKRTDLAINSLQHQARTIKENLNRATASCESILKAFLAGNDLLPVQFGIGDIAGITAFHATKSGEFAMLSGISGVIKEISKQVNQLTEQISTAEKSLILLEGDEKVKSERISMLQLAINAGNQQLLELRNQNTILVQSAIDLVLPYGIAFSYDVRKNVEQSLTTRINQFSTNRDILHRANLSLADNERDWKNTIEARDESQKQLEAKNEEHGLKEENIAELKRKRYLLFGDKNPAAERTRLTKDYETKQAESVRMSREFDKLQGDLKYQLDFLSQTKTDLEKEHESRVHYTNELQDGITAEGFETIDALIASFIDDHEAARIDELQREVTGNLTNTRQRLVETSAEIKREQEKERTTETIENLQQQINEKQHQVTEINREIGGIQNKMKVDETREKEYEDLKKQENLKLATFTKWNKLNRMIGSEKGTKFRKYAQGLTLQRLTELANIHLSNFTDRYTIVKTEEKDLELQVIDGYQADVPRPVNTLSGGESFLVSLALALGLSDMAGRKVQINSLFIDEGFGSLDADTLDTALTALESLQSKGKMIGVITHVDLKDRISTQVQVSKLSGGNSKIRVVSGGVGVWGW